MLMIHVLVVDAASVVSRVKLLGMEGRAKLDGRNHKIEVVIKKSITTINWTPFGSSRGVLVCNKMGY